MTDLNQMSLMFTRAGFEFITGPSESGGTSLKLMQCEVLTEFQFDKAGVLVSVESQI